MKKIISLAMCLILLLSLCACGKSKQAKAVEEQISTIGDVSLEKEAAILSTLENYNQLSDDEKETVENYSILENAIDTINALKQAEIETALEEIETLIKQAEMEQAEASCLELLESGNLSAEQEQMANDYLNDIALMCFAGTYIVLPDYITGRDAERVTGATVEKILNGGQAFVDFYYKREGDFKVAKDYCLSYLNSRFTLVSSDTRSTMLTTYIFCDADRNEFALNVISTPNTNIFDLNMELTNGLFDHSKLDSDNPDAGIWETSKAVLRK